MIKELLITVVGILFATFSVIGQEVSPAVVPDGHTVDTTETTRPARVTADDPRPTLLPTRAGQFSSLRQSQQLDLYNFARNSSYPQSRSIPRTGFNWSAAIKQSLLFLAVQHGYAMTQPKTRAALHGPFFRDYLRSVRSLHGWEDGGRFFTNYVAHPMEGAFTGFIQIQNDPKGRALKVGKTKEYWNSRTKAFAWSAAWSLQFEIGPLSQASIGNVGLKGKQTYVDIVITPTAGTAFLVTEDLLDQYFVRRIERRFGNRIITILARMLLNPTRTMANVVRFEKPWFRDNGLR